MINESKSNIYGVMTSSIALPLYYSGISINVSIVVLIIASV